jgi:alpha-L-arabinofuranosidase
MNGKHMCMSVVNKSSSEKILLKVPYLDRIAENYCIEGSNKVDLNTYANTSKVKIKKNSLKTSKGFLILPPHSISVVLFNI